MSSSPRVSSRLSILALLLTLGAPAPILAQGWPRPNGPVRALAVQADGKILVGGDFTMLDPAVTVFDGTGTRFGRLFPDGTLDRAFANTWADQPVETIALQPDGKILVGGSFTILCGSLRNHLARLNADGTLDAGFTAGADGAVKAIALRPDGAIVVAGSFTTLFGGSGPVAAANIGVIDPDGTVDPSVRPSVNGTVVQALALQADGKIVAGGSFVQAGTPAVPRANLARFNGDGTIDATFNPGANDMVWSLAVQADGKIVAGGGFTALGNAGTAARNHLGRLADDGSPDPTFNPSADNTVRSVVIQPSGRIAIGGDFTAIAGTSRRHLARLKLDGTVDGAFGNDADGAVYAIAQRSDGDLLIGGSFTSLGHGTVTVALSNLAHLSKNGWAVTAFAPDGNCDVSAAALQPDEGILAGGCVNHTPGPPDFGWNKGYARLNPDGSEQFSGALDSSGRVAALAVQPDGRIVIGGSFVQLNYLHSGTVTRRMLARLASDGAIEPGFFPWVDGIVHAVVVQPDGKILVGGEFTQAGDFFSLSRRAHLARLNADGSLDTTFNPGANDRVTTIALQPDGKILVGGWFTAVGGGTGTTPRRYLARLNADGSVDAFDPGARRYVDALAVQPDGRILVGGDFSPTDAPVSTPDRAYITRLNADGTVDTAFDGETNGPVATIALQADGRMVIGGGFTFAAGPKFIVRLFADGTLDDSLAARSDFAVDSVTLQPDGGVLYNGGAGSDLNGALVRGDGGVAADSLDVVNGGTSVRWTRSGAAPEVTQVTFEISRDDVTYAPLGKGSYVGGAWQLDGIAIPSRQGSFVRARGVALSGRGNASSSLIESVRYVYLQSACTFTLTADAAVERVGATSAFSIAADPACTWTADSQASWITAHAAGKGPGTVAFTVAANPDTALRVGTVLAGNRTFTITQGGDGPSNLSIDTPSSGITVSGAFTVSGWALNRYNALGTGVDAVHVWGFAADGSSRFLGAATPGISRPDVGALYGPRYSGSGFNLRVPVLPPGRYTIVAYAHNAVSGVFDANQAISVTVQAPASAGLIAVDTPAASATVTSAFEVGGWSLDAGAASGTGVDAVQYYIQPQGAPAPGVFIGTGSYGAARTDVGAIYGSRFTDVGYHFTITGLGPGQFTLNVQAHSTVTNSYSIVKAVPITVSATALMSIDAPAPEATITASSFLVGGWSIDRSVESTQLSGSGVDTLHVYAYPNPGSGQTAIFLGVATIGVSRPDVGAAYGARYATGGYNLTVNRAALGLTPGVYDIVVHSHSVVSGTFNNVALVRVTLQ